MMNEEDRPNAPNSIASTVAAVIVMMVMIVSVALPILASVSQDLDPQLSAMIGVIPILMIVGVVLFVVRQFNKSSR